MPLSWSLGSIAFPAKGTLAVTSASRLPVQVLFGELAAAGKGAAAQISVEEGSEADAETGSQAVDVASVDRAFAKRVLTQ